MVWWLISAILLSGADASADAKGRQLIRLRVGMVFVSAFLLSSFRLCLWQDFILSRYINIVFALAYTDVKTCRLTPFVSTRR